MNNVGVRNVYINKRFLCVAVRWMSPRKESIGSKETQAIPARLDLFSELWHGYFHYIARMGSWVMAALNIYVG